MCDCVCVHVRLYVFVNVCLCACMYYVSVHNAVVFADGMITVHSQAHKLSKLVTPNMV